MKKNYLKNVLTFVLVLSTTILFSQNKITSFPYTESFESGLGDWVQSADDDFDWSWNTGGTPSTGTGPNAAYDGSYYIYTEASGFNNVETYLDASFDLSSISNPFLFFYYHMYGADMGSLHIDIWDGTWNQDIFVLSGQQQTDYSSDWKQAAVDLTSFVGNDSIVIRLRGITGPSYMSDICIDSISVLEPAEMSYVSSTTNQPVITNVSQNTTDNIIAVIEITTDGFLNPLEINAFNLNSTGSDDFNNDISNVKIFYTQSLSAFNTSPLFGSSPDLSIPIAGYAKLSDEKNYFWVTYDISENATPENIIDVECTIISFNGAAGDQVPTITSPVGYRTIDPIMNLLSEACFTASTDDVMQNKNDYAIIGINIQTENSSDPLNISEIKFKPTGSDDFTNDVYKVNLYYTANSDVFDTNNLFGTATTNDTIITGSQELELGNNYFWITYDIYSSATVGNKVDAECHYLMIEGIKYFPTDSAPAGNRTIIEYSKYYNFMPANIVVGQPDFYTQNTTLDEYTGISSSSSDVNSKGVLAVGSQGSGRILIWNHIPDTNGTPADIVLGNPDFYTENNGPTDAFMNNVESVCFSPDGEKLIASDGGNNRVLIWNSIPTTNGQPADVVIGQNDFTSSSTGLGPDKFNYPWGVFITPTGKLIIGDRQNNRFLIYNQIPTENGASADIVIGQPDMYTNSPSCSVNKMSTVTCATLSTEGKLILSDRPGLGISGNF